MSARQLLSSPSVMTATSYCSRSRISPFTLRPSRNAASDQTPQTMPHETAIYPTPLRIDVRTPFLASRVHSGPAFHGCSHFRRWRNALPLPLIPESEARRLFCMYTSCIFELGALIVSWRNNGKAAETISWW